MKIEQKTITPEMAAIYMEGNVLNRKIRGAHVDFLASEMANGRWLETHQGIAIANGGRLLDGQHRLAAIIKCGIPQKMMVATGVDEGSFGVIDYGKSRTMSDVSNLSSMQVTACYNLMTISGFPSSTKRASADQLKRVFKFIEVADSLVPTKKKAKFFSSSVARSAVLFLISTKPENTEHYAASYERLASIQTDAFAPIEHAAYRAVVANGSRTIANASVRENFAYLCYVYSPENSQLTRVGASEEYKKKICAEVKMRIAPLMAK